MKGWSDEEVEKAVRRNDHVVATDDNGMRIWTWQADDEAEPTKKGTTVKQAKEMVKPGDHMVIIPNGKAKYRNNIVVYHCHYRGVMVFDSIKEFERYKQLRMLEAGEYIEQLFPQKPFELQPAFTLPDGTNVRAITYRADFYYEENGVGIVEDVKGMHTKEFNLKWKMMQYKYGQHYELRLVK